MNEWLAPSMLHLNFDIHSGGQIEIREIIDRFRVGIEDVDEPFVNPHLVLIARILVDKSRAVDRHLVDLGRERDWTGNLRACTLCRFDNLSGRLVDDFVVISLNLDPDSCRYFFFFLRSHDL